MRQRMLAVSVSALLAASGAMAVAPVHGWYSQGNVFADDFSVG